MNAEDPVAILVAPRARRLVGHLTAQPRRPPPAAKQFDPGRRPLRSR